MPSVKKATRFAATVVAVPTFVINVLFCLFAALVGCLFCADLIISLMYQFAMPTSPATAVSSLILLTAFTPWIVVFITALADWRRWPTNYPRLQSLLKRIFRRAARRCYVATEQREAEDSAKLQMYKSSVHKVPVPSSASSFSSANPNDLPDDVAEAVELEWQDFRELMRYSSCLLIWTISLLVAIHSSFTATWLFVVLVFGFIICNTIFDLRRLRRRPIGESASVYILFRRESLSVTIFALIAALITLTAVVSRVDIEILGGGVAAVVVAYVFTILTLALLFYMRIKAPRDVFNWEVITLGSRTTLSIAARDVFCLFVASMLMFGTTGPEAGGAVLAFTAIVGGCHAILNVSRATVRLRPAQHQKTESDSDEDEHAEGGDASLLPRSANQHTLNQHDGDHHELTVHGGDAAVANYEAAGDEAPASAECNVGRGGVFDTRRALRRVGHSLFVFFGVFVAGTSLIDTSGVSYPQICPGNAPGRSAEEGRFALCAIDFAPSSLTTVDFTVLTAVSYMEYGAKAEALRLFFPNRTAIIDDSASVQSLGTNKAFIGVNFTVIRFPLENVTVVTVRGSFTSIDWLQDLYVMSDTLAIQVGKTVLPLPLSDGVAASLVALGGSFKFGMKSCTRRVEEAIEAVRSSRPDDAVFVTGHSLGGFTANVVAARTHTRSVTMSPIGTGFTYKRYDFSKTVADEYQLSIIPEGDVVPKIDEQLGLLQFFVNPEGCTPANAFCHAIASTLRVITANCGDPLDRRVVPTPGTHC